MKDARFKNINNKQVQRFGIRKLTVGVTSVLLSTVIFLSFNQNAKADSIEQPGSQIVEKNSSNSQISDSNNQKTDTQTVDKNRLTSTQNIGG